MVNRIQSYVLTLAAASAVAVSGATAEASYRQVFTFADAVANTGATFFDSYAVDGADVFVFARTPPVGVDVIQKVTDAGTPGQSVSTFVSTVDWQAGSGAARLAAQFGSDVIGSDIVFGNFFNNSVYRVDTTTGAITTVAGPLDIAAATGATGANISSTNTLDADGNLFARDGTSRTVVKVEPSGAVSVAISTAELEAVTGSNLINGSLAVDPAGKIYWGRSGLGISVWDPATSSGSVLFDQATLNSAQGLPPGSSINFRDLFMAPDGMMYFFEIQARDILKFDPLAADPAATLELVINRNALEAGVGGGSLVQKLGWFDGNLAWNITDGTPGFYVIPEPASLSILGVGSLLMLRRRRA